MTNDRAWQVNEADYPADGPLGERLAFLIRYAVLAPSSHNTQPWSFSVSEAGVGVFVEPDRWLRVADADRRELYVSMGCALENLLVAAEHFGLEHRTHYFPDGEETDMVARVELAPSGGEALTRRAGLFPAIARRHTNHGRYDGRPLEEDHYRALEAAAAEPGVALHLTDEVGVRRAVDELTARADALQFADPEWRAELAYWLGQGVFGTGWLMSKMAKLAVTWLDMSKRLARQDTDLLDSASALGLICTRDNGRIAQVKAGQTFEAMFLAAAGLGVQVQPMNQVLQLREIRAELHRLLPEDWGRPQMAFRVGYAKPEDHTPRRPLQEVLH